MKTSANSFEIKLNTTLESQLSDSVEVCLSILKDLYQLGIIKKIDHRIYVDVIITKPSLTRDHIISLLERI